MADCFTLLKENFGDVFSDKELKDFLDSATRAQQEGHGPKAFRQKMMEKVEANRLALAKYKAIVSQNIAKNSERWAEMSQPAFEGKPWEALSAHAEGSKNYLSKGGNLGIHDIGVNTELKIKQPMYNTLLDNNVLERAQRGTDDLDVIKAMHDPASTTNTAAQVIAKAYQAAFKSIRKFSEDAGYPLGDLGPSYMTQRHGAEKIQNVGRDVWGQDLLKTVDHEKTFGPGASEAEKKAFLDEMYKKISNHSWGKTGIPEGGADRFYTVSEKGTGSKLGGSRSVHFKDPEGFFEYNSKYGDRGSLLETVSDKIESESRRLASLSKYGSNPLDAFAADVQKMKAKYKDNPEILNKLKDKEESLISGAKVAMGLSSRLGDNLKVKLANAALAVQNSSKLFLAMPKKSTELAYGTALTSSFTGASPLKNMVNISKHFFEMGFPGSEKEMMAQRQLMTHYINDSNAQVLTDRYGSGYNEAGTLSKLNDITYKYSGINMHTNRSRLATAANLSRQLESVSDKSFSELNSTLQANLGRYKIGEKEWELMRASRDSFGHDNSKGLMPGNLHEENPNVMKAAQSLGVDNPGKLVRDTQTKFMAAMNDIAETSVLHSNVALQNMLRGTGHLNPNTWLGAIYRVAMQYKSVAFMMGNVTSRVLQSDSEAIGKGLGENFIRGLKPGGSTVNYMVPMMAAGTALYALQDSLTHEIKNVLLPADKKESLPDYTNPREALRAFAGGSGAGIWGDAVLGHASDSGEKMTKFAGGPSLGQAYDLVNATGEIKKGEYAKGFGKITKIVEDNTPGATIPYFKNALDSLFFDHVQNAIDPEYSEKKELRQLKREQKTQ